MRLIRVEIRRLLYRRVFRLMLLLIFLGLAAVLGTTAYQSKAPSAQDRIAAQRQAEDVRQHSPPIEEQIEDCEQQEKSAGARPGDFGCDQIRDPRAEDFLQDKTFRFRQDITDPLIGFSVCLALFGFVVGASFIGAEWSAGTLAALLTWEPRRLRVLLAKILGLGFVVAVVGALVLAAAVGGHAGIAAWRGDTTGMTSGLLQSVGLSALRGVALAAAAGLIGFAIADTTRLTAGALGVGFAYFLGAELLLRNLWKASPPWLLTSNVGAWLSDGLTVELPIECPPGVDACPIKEVTISLADSAIYFGVVVGALLLICAFVFRRRDVT